MLGRKTPPSRGAARPDGALPEERRGAAWIGQSMVIKGEVKSSEDLTIAGHVEGEVDVSEHALTVGPRATIRANITARVVTVRGRVTGEIRASEKVQVGETGSVEGDILAPRVAVAEGAVLQGRIAMDAPAAT